MPDERAAFDVAARLSGVKLSVWSRSALREAAERRLANVGRAAPWATPEAQA